MADPKYLNDHVKNLVRVRTAKYKVFCSNFRKASTTKFSLKSVHMQITCMLQTAETIAARTGDVGATFDMATMVGHHPVTALTTYDHTRYVIRKSCY